MNIIDVTLDIIVHILSFSHPRDQKSFFDTCQVVRSYEEQYSVRWCFTLCLHDAVQQYIDQNSFYEPGGTVSLLPADPGLSPAQHKRVVKQPPADPVVLFIFGMYNGWLKTLKKRGYHIAPHNYWSIMYFLDAFTRGLVPDQNEHKAPRRLSYLRTRYMLPDHGHFFVDTHLFSRRAQFQLSKVCKHSS